jgi:hypothetical protein
MTLPGLSLLAILFVAALVYGVRWARGKTFERVMSERGWMPLPSCPVQCPWPGENFGPIRCFQAAVKPGLPCVVMVAKHLRVVVGEVARTHTVDPYLAIYLPPQTPLRSDALAAFRKRAAAATLLDPLHQAHSPQEGGVVLAWRSRPSIGYLDQRLNDVAQALVE